MKENNYEVLKIEGLGALTQLEELNLSKDSQ